MGLATNLRRLYTRYGEPLVDDIVEAATPYVDDIVETVTDVLVPAPAPRPRPRARAAELMRDPNFSRWFEGSRAVDEYGEPLMLVHGTRKAYDLSQFRPGTHFGTPSQANERMVALTADYSVGAANSTPVYLSVKNPLRVTDNPHGDWRDAIRRAEREGYDSLVYLNRGELPDDAINRVIQEEMRRGNLSTLSDEDFRVIAPEAEDSYIILDPRQVKSAVGNRGTYDPENPDMGMKKGGLAVKPVWDKKRPKSVGKPKALSDKQKNAAKARAKRAGRPYPNMVDNLAVARKKGKRK